MSRDDHFDIDQLALDREWQRQARLARGYYELAAEAQQELDDAKNKLELTRAELDLAIRRAPAEYGLEKVTEAVVASAIITQPAYQLQQAAVSDARHAVAIAKAACEGMDAKKRALEKLVDLFLAGYYAEPRAKSEPAREARADAEKREVRSRARRRRRGGEDE